MKRIMLDLETHGECLVSIGAVTFDEKGIGDEFYQVVNVWDCALHGLKPSLETEAWWMQQPHSVRMALEQSISGHGRDLSASLLAFVDFVGIEPIDELWGNGADFDCILLRKAFDAAKLPPPWSYKAHRCFRTMKNLFSDVQRPEFAGVKHNALDDARQQALHLIEIFRVIGNQARKVKLNRLDQPTVVLPPPK